MVRSHRLLVTALIFLSAVSFAKADLSFQFLATHPDAVLQPTTRGKTLQSISVFEGQLFFAYGDWAADTGPINVRSLSPSTVSWSNNLLTLGTEAISHYRQLSDKLYAVKVDPLGAPQVNPGGYGVGIASGSGTTWVQNNAVPATHDFDIAQFNNDLWVVGSQNTFAGIWRSSDGGQTFVQMRMDGPPPGSPPFVFSRYTGAASFNNSIYFQRYDVNGTHVADSLVFDGTAWSSGPDLLPSSNGFLFRPTEFGGQLVYLDDDLGAGRLYRFDGSQASLSLQDGVRDFFIASDKIFALSASGEVLVSLNLSDWDSLGFAPNEARSIAVMDNSVFVGTSSATVFFATLTNISSVPEPSTWLAILSVFAVTTLLRIVRLPLAHRR